MWIILRVPRSFQKFRLFWDQGCASDDDRVLSICVLFDVSNIFASKGVFNNA